jgi:ribosome-associated translation inhibitor RaiA
MNNTTRMTASEIHRWDLDIAPALREYIAQNMTDLEGYIDWVCDMFNISACDDVIDRVCDEMMFMDETL